MVPQKRECCIVVAVVLIDNICYLFFDNTRRYHSRKKTVLPKQCSKTRIGQIPNSSDFHLTVLIHDKVEKLNDHIMSFRLREHDCVMCFPTGFDYNRFHSSCNEFHELIAVGPDDSHIFLVIKTKDGENVFCRFIIYQYGNFIAVFDYVHSIGSPFICTNTNLKTSFDVFATIVCISKQNEQKETHQNTAPDGFLLLIFVGLCDFMQGSVRTLVDPYFFLRFANLASAIRLLILVTTGRRT